MRAHFLNLSNSTEHLGVSNQEDIICNVHGMNLHELLELVIANPFFLTDAYYLDIGTAVRARHAELKSDFCAYYSV